MSVMIYMTVTVEGEQVKPNVHVTSFQSAPWMHSEASTVLRETPMQDVRFGLQVAEEILSFAERLERESS